MTNAEDKPSDAVRYARETAFDQGVDYQIIEWRQLRLTPSLRGWARWGMLFGALKALAMIAPPAALLLPLGGSDFGNMMSGEGFAGDDLQAMVLVVFWIGAVGQGWVLLDWWRRGRERDGTAITTGVLAVLASALAVPWFSSMLRPHSFASLLVPIVATGLLGLAVLIAHLAASRPTVPNRKRIALAKRAQALPSDEQRALRDEREIILQSLQERQLIDASDAERARATPLGQWWTLEDDAGKHA